MASTTIGGNRWAVAHYGQQWGLVDFWIFGVLEERGNFEREEGLERVFVKMRKNKKYSYRHSATSF